MAAITHYYCDPSIGTSTGSGTIGDPWGTVAYAISQMGGGFSSGGEQLNVKSGTTTSGTVSQPSGAPGATNPFVVRGYDSAANDGGVAVFDGGGSAVFSWSKDYIRLVDLEIGNSGSNALVSLGARACLSGCYLHTSTASLPVSIGDRSVVEGCRIEHSGSTGLRFNGGSYRAKYNWIKNGGSGSTGIELPTNNGSSNTISGNIVVMSGGGASKGISVTNALIVSIEGNTIYNSSPASNSCGIQFASTINAYNYLQNNIISGFSGTSNYGIDVGTNYKQVVCRNNSFYNNTTDVRNPGEFDIYDDNESLGSDPFAKTGSLSYANRLEYFALNDVGSVRAGAYVGVLA